MGLYADELHSEHRFWRGSEFLLKLKNEWPDCLELAEKPSNESEPKLRNTPWVGTIKPTRNTIDDLMDRTSKQCRLVRAVAYVLRFVQNPRTKKEWRRTSELSVQEICTARDTLTLHAQRTEFYSELESLRAGRDIQQGSKLRKLSPFIDNRGLLCVGGRLDKASVPLDQCRATGVPWHIRVPRGSSVVPRNIFQN